MNTNICGMSEKQQEISGDIKPQVTECSNDIEMHEMESQLAEDKAAKESSVVVEEEEGACPQGTKQEEMSQDEGDEDAVVAGSNEGGGGEGKEKTADEEEMSQDEGDSIQNQQEDVVAAASNGEPGDEGGEGKREAIAGKEEQQPAEEREEVMSQDEEDVPNKETDADGGDGQVGDKGGEGRTGDTAGDGQVDEEGRAEERAGAAGADNKGAKVEEMASQGSTSDSDSDSETYEFPDTLEEFKFHFKDGRLLSEENKPFVFEVGKKKYNQARYEALGEVITEEVYKMLETETHLKKVSIPKKPKGNEPTAFIFMSEDALTNRDKLMILIHGSGVVRAGQWARSLIINDRIDSGTQIPYIKRAMEEGYGVIVLNTNYNSGGPKGTPIRGSGSPKEHAQYVWKKFVKGAKAKDVYIVAHSFGGVVTVDLMTTGFKEFKKKVEKIAFTDSVHVLPSRDVPQGAQEWITKHAVNWVTSDRPLNEKLESYPGDVSRRSAGTLKHVETSWFSLEHIFAYFSEK